MCVCVCACVLMTVPVWRGSTAKPKAKPSKVKKNNLNPADLLSARPLVENKCDTTLLVSVLHGARCK